MTGKLIPNLKRKHEQETSENSTEVISNSLYSDNEAGTSSSTSDDNENDNNIPEEQQYNVKRKKHNERDTPDSNSSSSNESTQSSSSSRNTFLIVALQKLIDLENDLNEIDNEFNINGLYDDFNDETDEEVSRINSLPKINDLIGGNDAKALGFAMCARETLLFLQNEGVPENSLLYKALKDRLVGKSDGIPI